jgi:hypothetical protein
MAQKHNPRREITRLLTQPEVDDMGKTAARAWRERTRDMLTRKQPQQLLQSFDVEHLLDLLEHEAKKSYDGHYTLFSFTTGYKVAFGTPDIVPCGTSKAYAQLAEMPGFPTRKDAIIAALVSPKTFADYFDGCPEVWWAARYTPEHNS